MTAARTGRKAGRRAERLARWLTPVIDLSQAQLGPAGFSLERVEISWIERRPLRLPPFLTAIDLWRSLLGWLLRGLPLHETVTVTVRFAADGLERAVVQTSATPKNARQGEWK